MIVPTVPQAMLLLVLGGVFVHFMIAGGRTFYSEDSDRTNPVRSSGSCCST